jgi:AAA ATPase domain
VVVYFSESKVSEMMMPTPDAGGVLLSEEAGPSRTRLRVGSLRVRGFRALKDLCLDLDPRLTVLIGENNSGKTSLLEALETVFGLRRGTEDDLHLDRNGRRDATFTVDLSIRLTRYSLQSDDATSPSRCDVVGVGVGSGGNRLPRTGVAFACGAPRLRAADGRAVGPGVPNVGVP